MLVSSRKYIIDIILTMHNCSETIARVNFIRTTDKAPAEISWSTITASARETACLSSPADTTKLLNMKYYFDEQVRKI